MGGLPLSCKLDKQQKTLSRSLAYARGIFSSLSLNLLPKRRTFGLDVLLISRSTNHEFRVVPIHPYLCEGCALDILRDAYKQNERRILVNLRITV